MTTTFKTFINERIYADNNKVVISVQTTPETSNKEAISTFVKRVPYKTSLRVAGGATVYSMLNYVSSPESTNLLSSLKGKGPYEISQSQLNFFVAQIVQACVALLNDTINPDVIIYPTSSSSFLANFVRQLRAAYPKAEVIDDAFVKKALSLDDIEDLINTTHPDFHKINPGDIDKLKQTIARQIKTKGDLELKKLFKPHLKFIKNWVELRNAYETLDKVLGKRVLIIDDVLSSGSTMIEMIRQLHELEPEYMAGLTIFKRNDR